jgi:hypothetical protein
MPGAFCYRKKKGVNASSYTNPSWTSGTCAPLVSLKKVSGPQSGLNGWEQRPMRLEHIRLEILGGTSHKQALLPDKPLFRAVTGILAQGLVCPEVSLFSSFPKPSPDLPCLDGSSSFILDSERTFATSLTGWFPPPCERVQFWSSWTLADLRLISPCYRF